jgi:hypothetical protein
MTTTQLSPRAALFGPILVVLCHLLALAAIASFTLRVGQAPLAETLLYAAAVLVSAAAVVYAWRNARDGRFTPAVEVASLLPLLAVFVLYASYGGPYAPWDPFDSDIVSVWYGTLATVIAVASVVAGSWRLLGLGLIGQAVLYLMLLPGSLWDAGRYGVANLVNAQVIEPFIAAYVVGVAAMAGRRALRSPGRASIVAGMGVLAIAASLLLAYAVGGLPPNGTDLAWYASGLSVPSGAWNWLRPVAIAGSLLAALLVFGLLCVQLGAGWTQRRPASGLPLATDPGQLQ